MYLTGNNIEAKIHNQEYSEALTMLLGRIKELERQVAELEIIQNTVINGDEFIHCGVVEDKK